MQSCQKDNRSFFVKLQNAEGLDLRDNRGKKHKLVVVARWSWVGCFEQSGIFWK